MSRTQRLLELLEHEDMDKLRHHAPTLATFFDKLRTGPLSAQKIRALIIAAENEVERDELLQVGKYVSDAVANAFAGLMMQVFSERM